MGKIGNWKKKIDSPNRIYWENSAMDNRTNPMVMNVERVGSYWYITDGTLKGQQMTRSYTSKKTALEDAGKVMRQFN